MHTVSHAITAQWIRVHREPHGHWGALCLSQHIRYEYCSFQPRDQATAGPFFTCPEAREPSAQTHPHSQHPACPGLTCLLVRRGSLWGSLQEPQISLWKVPPALQLLQQTRSDTVLMDGRPLEAPVTMQSCRHYSYILHSPPVPQPPETRGSGQCHLLDFMTKCSHSRKGQGPWGCLPSLGGQVRLLPHG